ncbi:hypothetical protein EAE99_009840 [Botrytis elliptica]|nr:hypothetical protein EAE99_009840 [Botrytis elliptica]
MACENQKSGRKFKPKPRRATPAERRARNKAEEARLQSEANGAAAAQAARLEEQRIEREAEEIEEKENAMTTAAEATVIRPDSVLSPSEGGVGGEDDQGMGGRSGVILGAGGGAIHQNLVSRPKPLTPEQQSARRLHLALRRRAADVRRKEARRAARRKECAGLIKKVRNLRIAEHAASGGNIDDEEEEDEEEEDEIFESLFAGGDWGDDDEEKDGDGGGSGGGGGGLGGMFGAQAMMV